MKLCPFCQRAPAKKCLRRRAGLWHVHCIVCGTFGPDHLTKDGALMLWDNRPKPEAKQLDALIAKLRRANDNYSKLVEERSYMPYGKGGTTPERREIQERINKASGYIMRTERAIIQHLLL